MNIHRPKTQRERGQAVVLVALMALTLVAFAGLALDGAQYYAMRRRMQNAADAGAYVGANELSLGHAYQVIASKVNTYTVGGQAGSIGGSTIDIGNGAQNYTGVYLPSGNPLNTPYASGDNCVRVSTAITFPTIMIGLIPVNLVTPQGFDSLQTQATAKACYGAIVSTDTALWPMLIHTPTAPIVYGQVITIFNDGTLGGSQFGWADFDGGNNNSTDTENWLTSSYSGIWHISDYVSNACNGSNQRNVGFISVGDCLDGDTGLGNSNGIRNAIEAKVTGHISVTVLIYDNAVSKADGSGNNTRYHIVGFGRFKLVNCYFSGGQNCDGTNKTGSTKFVSGSFEKWVGPGNVCVSCPIVYGVTGVSLSP